jgi:hypothetical protein
MGSTDAASVPRIDVATAYEKIRSGRATLVCAYDDARCAQYRLDHSVPVSQLDPNLPRDTELIFYCA